MDQKKQNISMRAATVVHFSGSYSFLHANKLIIFKAALINAYNNILPTITNVKVVWW